VVTNGYSPSNGDSFDLFDWNGVSGAFATTNFSALSFGLAWNSDSLYSSGELSVEYSIEDADLDGMPDGWGLEHCGGDVEPGGNLDLDPHNNLAEYIAGTDPDDEESFFQVTNTAHTVSGFVITWEPSVTGRWYDVNWTTNLIDSLAPLATNFDFPQSSYTDAVPRTRGFYDVDVRLK